MATPHDLTLVFEDGRSLRITGSAAETVYMTALKNKIRILTDCLEGACATCKAHCTHGEYSLREYSEEALSDEEFAARRVLTCQMVPKSDCVIEFGYESNVILKTAPETRSGTVIAVETVAENVAKLVVAPADPAKPISFLPGQYVHLSVPGTDAHRSYSFANVPDAPELVFYIKVLPQGAMSEYVGSRAKPGDAISIVGPFGKFYLRPPARPIVMVAGGTGLAPMLSMFDHMVAGGGTGQPITLLYGANTASELFARQQLENYAQLGLNIATERVVVSGAGGWQGPTGHVTGRLRDEIINDGNVDVYLCGPPPMIEAGQAWLKSHGVPDERVHIEKFLSS